MRVLFGLLAIVLAVPIWYATCHQFGGWAAAALFLSQIAVQLVIESKKGKP